MRSVHDPESSRVPPRVVVFRIEHAFRDVDNERLCLLLHRRAPR
jgi:hypothetical protein